MSDAQLGQVADGRVFTGRQGVGLKLVDELGNEKAARAWLEKEKHVSASIPARDVSLSPRFSEFSFLHVAAWSFDTIGLSTLARQIDEWGGAAAVERLNLDGLLALWHPPGSR
jgi:protease-4